jgi:hypothetical protein
MKHGGLAGAAQAAIATNHGVLGLSTEIESNLLADGEDVCERSH